MAVTLCDGGKKLVAGETAAMADTGPISMPSAPACGSYRCVPASEYGTVEPAIGNTVGTTASPSATDR